MMIAAWGHAVLAPSFSFGFLLGLHDAVKGIVSVVYFDSSDRQVGQYAKESFGRVAIC